MTVGKQKLLAALQLRFDHYSANAVLENALSRSGIADKAQYTADEVAQLSSVLGQIESRVEAVQAHFTVLAGGKTELSSDEAKPEPAPVAEAEAEAEATSEAEAASESEKAAKPEPEAKRAAEVASSAVSPAAKAGATLSLAGVEVADDGVVLVCGGGAALGDWKPEGAPALERGDDGWTVTLSLPPGSKAEFKFLTRSAKGKVEWEPGDNRQLQVGADGVAELTAEWRRE